MGRVSHQLSSRTELDGTLACLAHGSPESRAASSGLPGPSFDGAVPSHCPSTLSWLLGPSFTPSPPRTHTRAERMQVAGGFADQMCACSGLCWTLFHLISCGTCFGYTIVESGESPVGLGGLVIVLCALGPTLCHFPPAAWCHLGVRSFGEQLPYERPQVGPGSVLSSFPPTQAPARVGGRLKPFCEPTTSDSSTYPPCLVSAHSHPQLLFLKHILDIMTFHVSEFQYKTCQA